MSVPELLIRAPRPTDVDMLVKLTAELGYAATAAQLHQINDLTPFVLSLFQGMTCGLEAFLIFKNPSTSSGRTEKQKTQCSVA